ncbi:MULTISPECIES: mycofactocin-coupled SDR family oxidoreductase [Rhodococcus]|jgi:SDR family mycofactocin-dependent oxidoreductase|uniref:Mycofactocin-coupled SDR family oxidoreductase n=1 Tax=Rhodococcus aetherivorans TaxID=191292 RepID=N1MEQ8_9NOCA|nr:MULTISPECIES: mycofactocin-coupled SDR family oxidoreductase [Rhodococcus]NCL77802.1 (-)-trans-carveol dehydrogenase [Rhodococcus sp. YH1]ANZ26747.1 3-ketoacyl-ACP reductase [Rhodococcus sp. WB1]MBC2591789.1 mycofactocin-coupled SDR family oxidoreductase [Rhodococcus aetherivorans]PND51170.1 NAD(P)-dependent oxidoreductase [Rhodococcus sp. ENV425]QIX48975.1 mycofactocin-coupled SDR family oxidoreductase [Rhodococcus sp. DMU1]
MNRLQDKVAFITGAGRGQGRAHAVRLAEEGANIIAVDLCANMASVPYDLATQDDLAETARLVDKAGGRIVARTADVRDLDSLRAAVDAGVAEFGRLDIVVANAGIWSSAPFLDMPEQTYHEMIDVQMHGPYNTCRAALPHIVDGGRGGSVIIISSTAGMRGFPNQVHYNMGKHAVVGLMRTLANEFAPQFIRVNTIHPSSVDTKMIQNDAIWSAFAPGVENPTFDDFGDTFTAMNLLPVPWMEPEAISGAVAWLASDDAKYVTGATIPVDAGYLGKYN